MEVENFISTGDIEGLAKYCEEAELTAPLGVPSPEIYGSLLAVYLLQNELDHAKLLWKRIPGSVKVSNPEIGELWEIGKKLWKREFPDIYPLIDNTVWPPHVVPLLSQLIEKIRHRVILLVSQAYSNIRLKELCLMLGLNEEATLTVVTGKGWVYDETSQVLIPKLSHSDFNKVEESQERLARLVDIVSFLEN